MKKELKSGTLSADKSADCGRVNAIAVLSADKNTKKSYRPTVAFNVIAA